MLGPDYNKLRIKMKDGTVEEYTSIEWDDYEINYGFVIVKYRGIWIAAYNTDSVAVIRIL